MIHFTVAAALSAAALTHALPGTVAKRQEAGGVSWGECDYEWSKTLANQFQQPLECGKLSVPLDYSDDTDERTIDLDLMKISATKEPRLGSMLYNPGGPGQSGIHLGLSNSHILQLVGGGQYDFIVFDPRGTGRTLPVKCLEDAADTLERRDGPLYSQDVMEVAERLWPEFANRSESCAGALAETGEYYGTAFVARDMLRIAEALEDDGLLRYLGTSYGTLLGWTFAAMFPDKVDRMILDGNINPNQYWSGLDVDSFQSVDDLFKVILDACFEADDICPLAEYGDTESVLTALSTYFENWKPLPVPGTERIFQLENVKLQLVKQMYNPGEYFSLTEQLNKMLSMTPEEFMAAEIQAEMDKPKSETAGSEPEPWHKSGEMSIYAIRCGDWPIRADDPSEMEGIIEMLNMGSWADVSASDWMTCYSWPFKAKEQYAGTFEAETKTPILYVNPTWDPVTPLASARNSSSTMEGSVVLEQRTAGHGVMSSPNACTMQYMRDYMVDGTLPKEGTVCEGEFPIFANLSDPERAIATNKVYIDIIKDSNGIDVEAFADAIARAAGGENGTDASGAGGATASEDDNSGASSLSTSLVAAFVGVAAFMATF